MKSLTIEITQAERKQILKDATAALAERLYDESAADELRLISKARAAGLLDVDPKTLDSMGLPRVALADGKLIKYLVSDVAAFIKSCREK